MVTARFGAYELVRRLGSGGMAETFLAVRRGPGGFVQHVCVKRILPALEADPSFVSQFLEEARLAATLRHASIAQVVDFGAVGESHYLALELVDGMDLRQLLARLRERGQTLEVPFAVWVALQLAGALEHAHAGGRGRAPVVHRDVSPSNVLVSRAGEVYLTDFGIARALGPSLRTESGVVRGKVPYMAPEYALRGTADARADLFGLGVLLYEALAGQRPFLGATDLDILSRIQSGVHEPLLSLAPATPAPLAEAIERLLLPRPEARFESASELIEALAPVAPPPTTARALGKLVQDLSESLTHSLELALSGETPATETLSHEISTTEPVPRPPPAREDRRADPSPPADAPVARSELPTRTARRAQEPPQAMSLDSPHAHPEPAPPPPAPQSVAQRPLPEPAPPPRTTKAAAIPTTRGQHPSPVLGAAREPASPASRRPLSRAMWAALVLLALVTFAAATAGTYALVRALREVAA